MPRRVDSNPTHSARSVRSNKRAASLLLTLLLVLASPGIVQTGAQERSTHLRYRVQLIYAVPMGGTDQKRDQDGSILGSVESAQRWLESQTGRRARFATRDGEPVIRRLDLTRTADEIAEFDVYASTQIEYELRAQGYDEPGMIYGVYYEGTGAGCGFSATPPDTPGNSFTLFVGDPVCTATPFAAADEPPGYLEFSLIHELFHTLGAVPNCAPHANGSNHIDDPHELMHQGEDAWYPEYIDKDHDDYFDTGRDDCYDVAKSPYLSPQSADMEAADPGSVDLDVEQPCGDYLVNSWTSEPVTLQVTNISREPIELMWIDEAGDRQLYETLDPWETVFAGAYVDGPWQITSQSGECIATFTMPDTNASFWVSDEDV